MRLRSSISFRELDEKGALPSKACSTIPSSKSPRVMSFNSANAFSTFRMRFSIRTPVCTRSTSTCRAAPVLMVPMYQDNLYQSNGLDARLVCWSPECGVHCGDQEQLEEDVMRKML